MNLKRLYGVNGLCKLCETPDHEDDCPGRILDGMKYEIKFSPNCTRGSNCCSWQVESVEAATLEESADLAVSRARGYCNPEFTAYLSFELGQVPLIINAAQTRWHEEQAREKAAKHDAHLAYVAETRLKAYGAARERLEKDHPDLSEQGYKRRWQAIEDEFAFPLREWAIRNKISLEPPR